MSRITIRKALSTVFVGFCALSVLFAIVPREVARSLAHGVRRALEPMRVVRRLLGRQNLDETLGEEIHAIRLRNVPVEGRRIELRQDEDPADIGVQAVADRDVYEPVFSADGDCGLRALEGEREKTRAPATAEHDGQDLGVYSHDSQMLHRRVPVRAGV